jgi:hypothetical protein
MWRLGVGLLLLLLLKEEGHASRLLILPLLIRLKKCNFDVAAAQLSNSLLLDMFLLTDLFFVIIFYYPQTN